MRSTPIIAAFAVLAGCPGTGPSGNFPWERGCILVDGDGGWLFLSDALTQAVDGSTIELCEDFVDTVVIDKELTFTGNPLALPEWRAPDNEPAMRIVDGGSVTVQDVFISTSRNGFTVEEGGALDLNRVWIRVDNPGSYGIEIVGGDVTASNIIIEDAFWGAIQNTGGTLHLTESDLVNSFRWGVRLDDGATATIEDTLIGGTFISDDVGANNDGWAVFVGDGCEATLTDVDLESNVLGGAYVERGILNATGGTWLGNFIAGWFDSGTVTLTDVEVLDPLQYGIVTIGSNVVFTDVTLDADPLTSPFEDPLTSNLEGGYGVVIFDGELTWHGGVIREFNGGGLYGGGNASAQLPIALTQVSIEDNSALGIQVSLTDLTATDLKVTGTINQDEICVPDGFTYGCNWGVAAFASDVDWVGGAIRDNGSIGFVSSDGPADLTLVEIADNQQFGIWSIAGVLNLDQAEITGGGLTAIELQDQSFVTIANSRFHDRTHIDSFSFDNIEYQFHYSGVDINAFDSIVSVLDSDFRAGDAAISAVGSELTVLNTTFADYNRLGVRISGGSADIDRSNFFDFGGDAITCSSGGDLAVQRSSIAGVTEIEQRTVILQDGEVSSDQRSWYPTAGMRTSGCTVEMSNLTVSDVDWQAVSLIDSDISEIDSVDITRVGTAVGPGQSVDAALEIFWGSTEPELTATEVTITDVRAGDAMLVQSANTSEAGDITLEGLLIGDESGLASDGLQLVGLMGATLTGFDITGAGATGLHVQNTTATIDGTDLDGDFTGTVGAAGVGIVLDNSTVTLSDTTVVAADNGMSVVGSAQSTLTNVSLTSSAATGMTCATVAPVCSTVTATGAIAEHDNCGACFD